MAVIRGQWLVVSDNSGQWSVTSVVGFSVRYLNCTFFTSHASFLRLRILRTISGSLGSNAEYFNQAL